MVAASYANELFYNILLLFLFLLTVVIAVTAVVVVLLVVIVMVLDVFRVDWLVQSQHGAWPEPLHEVFIFIKDRIGLIGRELLPLPSPQPFTTTTTEPLLPQLRL